MRSIGPDNHTSLARLRARMAAAAAVARARLHAEGGSALIEVMVGAVLVAIASVAILNGLDGAQATGAKNKVRSVQATLAQQDIERMRSIPVTALSNLNQTRTVTVTNVDYTVVSETSWVSDRNGVVNCSDNNAQADYLKLSSTVTSPASASRPVTETGLLTPTVGQLSTTTGSATVKLTDRDGSPLAGVPVSLTGPSSRGATTNALGCAVFGYIPVGTYTVTVNGFVEIDSNPASDSLVVYPGRASFGQLAVDRPATVRANFVAPTGNSFAPASALAWNSITVKNANLAGGKRVFTRAAGRNVFVEGSGLFPYTDGVGVYAGSCAANDPSAGDPRTNVRRKSYIEKDSPRGWTALSPGDAQRNVNVEMPTLRVTVTRQTVLGSVPAWFRTQLLVTSKDNAGDPACTLTAQQLQPPDRATNVRTPVVFDIAVPFGEYRVCAATRGRTSGLTGSTGILDVNRRYTTTTTASTNPTNPADQNLKTPVPPTANRAITITTPTLSNALCF